MLALGALLRQRGFEKRAASLLFSSLGLAPGLRRERSYTSASGRFIAKSRSYYHESSEPVNSFFRSGSSFLSDGFGGSPHSAQSGEVACTV